MHFDGLILNNVNKTENKRELWHHTESVTSFKETFSELCHMWAGVPIVIW